MPRTFHHSLTPHFYTVARAGWRGGKKLWLRWWGVDPEDTGQEVQGDRGASVVDEVASTFASGTDDGGIYTSLATSTSTGNEAYVRPQRTLRELKPNTDFYMFERFSVSHLTNVRFFMGLARHGSAGTINDSDDQDDGSSGIQFSTARPDTNLQFYHRDGSGGYGIIDTGVAPVVDKVYQLEQEFSGSGTSLRARLSDHDGGILWGDVTVTSPLPSASTGLAPVMGMKTLAGESKAFRLNQVEVWA